MIRGIVRSKRILPWATVSLGFLWGAGWLAPGLVAAQNAASATTQTITLTNSSQYAAIIRSGDQQTEIPAQKNKILNVSQFPTSLEYWSGSLQDGWLKQVFTSPGVYQFAFENQHWSISKREAVAAPPEVVMQEIVTCLREHRFNALWQFLPDRYQRDLKDLLVLFSNKMDQEVWDKASSVIAKSTRLAKEKREFFLANPAVTKYQYLTQHWDELVELVDLATKSELATIDGLAKLDLDQFLAGDGGKLLNHGLMLFMNDPAGREIAEFIETSKTMKITVVSRDGDRATVQETFTDPNKPPEIDKLQSIDGKWIIEGMFDGWDQKMDQAKTAIGGMKLDAPAKAQFMAGLSLVDGALDQLLNSQTQQQFDAVIQGLMTLMSIKH